MMQKREIHRKDVLLMNYRLFKLKLIVTNIVHVYAPTNDSTEDEIELLYNNLQELIQLTRAGEITFIIFWWIQCPNWEWVQDGVIGAHTSVRLVHWTVL